MAQQFFMPAGPLAVLPLVGGVDLSPLVLLVLLQIAALVLGDMQGRVLALSLG